MEKNFKSQRAQDLEPHFKPIHSKTMSLVGMLKQYATAGGMGANNDVTERFDSAIMIPDMQPEQRVSKKIVPADQEDDLSDVSGEYGSELGNMGLKSLEDLK